MKADEVALLPLPELARRIKEGETSCEELTELYLQRIKEKEGALNSYLTLLAEVALADARRLDGELKEGKYRGPLHGIPLGVKDIIHVKGGRTTAGSKILAQNVSQADAKVIGELRRAGAIILGKLNLHEFAFGVTNKNPHYGPCRNPWDTSRISGGSSGGSAVAVAAGLCAASLGTDSGGSIRIPSALCGVVGLKPTYGLVSCEGVIPLSWSLDHVGPLGRCVEDVRILLHFMCGGSAPEGERSERREGSPSGPLRLGLLAQSLEECSDEVRRGLEAALDLITGDDVEVVEVKGLKWLAPARSSAWVILVCEAYSFHSLWIREREKDYGDDVRARIKMGALLPASEYLKALKVRRLFQEELTVLMNERNLQALLLPTTPITAPRIEEDRVRLGDEELDARNVLGRLTAPFNLVGFPALSLPCALRAGLPIGLQLVGRPWTDGQLLSLGKRIEERLGWRARPPVA